MKQTRLFTTFGVMVALAVAGCGGGSDGGSETAREGDDRKGAIGDLVSQWANAYATIDPAACGMEAKQYEAICRQYPIGGKPTAYMAGYLNAQAEQIDFKGSDEALVTLTNGCKVEVTDEGKGRSGSDWRVTNAGGALARGCEQGTG